MEKKIFNSSRIFSARIGFYKQKKEKLKTIELSYSTQKHQISTVIHPKEVIINLSDVKCEEMSLK